MPFERLIYEMGFSPKKIQIWAKAHTFLQTQHSLKDMAIEENKIRVKNNLC